MRIVILWAERARRDLLEIGDFIARDKPEAAAKWTNNLLDAVGRTALFPTSGRIVPEIDRTDIREIVFSHYRVVYQLGTNQIIVLTIFESHKLIDDSLVKDGEST